MASGKVLRKFESQAQAVDFAFSHDGRKLVSGDFEGKFRVWDLASGKQDIFIDLKEPSANPVVAFSADDRTLLMGRFKLTYWDVASGKHVREFKGAKLSMFTVALSNDAQKVAATYTDNLDRSTIRVFEEATSKELWKLDGFGYRLTFSPDGKILAVLGFTGKKAEHDLTLWDAATGKSIRQLEMNGQPMSMVFFGRPAFSADGRLLACGHRSAIRLWDVATGKELHRKPGHLDEIHSVVFSPDGKTVASRSNTEICLWDLAAGEQIRMLRGHSGYPVLFSCNGKMLISGGDGAIRIWDAPTGRELRKFVIANEKGKSLLPPNVIALSLSPDDRTLISFIDQGFLSGSSGDPVHIITWDITIGKQLFKYAPSASTRIAYSPVVFAPEGKAVALLEAKGWVLRDTRRGREFISLAKSNYTIGAPAFSPNGKLLAAILLKQAGSAPSSTSRADKIQVWETGTGQKVLQIPLTDFSVPNIAFSPDGTVIATGSTDAIRLWDVATGKELVSRRGHEVDVPSLAFAPDGRTLASGMGDTTLLLWDLAPATWKAGMPTRKLAPKEPDQIWADLAGADAAKAHQAIWTLVAAPEKALGFLKERLQPASPEKQKHIHKLITDLDSPRFDVRQKASRQLEQLAMEAEPALLRALAANPSPEARKRIETLLARPRGAPSSENLRLHRAVQVLEHIGTPEARHVLQPLANGAPESPLTEEARASLQRLARRPAAP